MQTGQPQGSHQQQLRFGSAARVGTACTAKLPNEFMAGGCPVGTGDQSAHLGGESRQYPRGTFAATPMRPFGFIAGRRASKSAAGWLPPNGPLDVLSASAACRGSTSCTGQRQRHSVLQLLWCVWELHFTLHAWIQTPSTLSLANTVHKQDSHPMMQDQGVQHFLLIFQGRRC